MVPKLLFLASVSMRICGDYKALSSPISDLTDTLQKVLSLFSLLTQLPPLTINFLACHEGKKITVFPADFSICSPILLFLFVSLLTGNVKTHIP